jgi:hypothetical protein
MEIGFGKVSISTGMSSINQAIISLGGPFAVALSGNRVKQLKVAETSRIQARRASEWVTVCDPLACAAC